MGFLFNRLIKPNIINRITKMEKKIMAAIHDLQATVEAQGTVIDSAVVLLKGLHDKLSQCGTDEAKLTELKDEIAKHTASLAEAVATNTVAEGEEH